MVDEQLKAVPNDVQLPEVVLYTPMLQLASKRRRNTKFWLSATVDALPDDATVAMTLVDAVVDVVVEKGPV